MNCYDCKHRGKVSGSSHSTCTAFGEPVILFLGILVKTDGLIPASVHLEKDNEEHKLVFNEQGIVGGWCNWPVDFDPCWVKSCTAFEEKQQ